MSPRTGRHLLLALAASVGLLALAVAACDPVDEPAAADTGVALQPDAGGTNVPADAGSGQPGEDAGGIGGTPVDITFSAACPALAACGGDPTGTWTYTEACCDDPFPAARASCPSLTVENPSGTVQGGLRLQAGTLTRDITVQLSATLQVPVTCTLGSCATLQSTLRNAYDSVTCSAAAAGACTCQVSDTSRIFDLAAYTLDGGSLSATSGGNTTTYDFCVQGASIKYRETTAASQDKVLYTLGKK